MKLSFALPAHTFHPHTFPQDVNVQLERMSAREGGGGAPAPADLAAGFTGPLCMLPEETPGAREVWGLHMCGGVHAARGDARGTRGVGFAYAWESACD